MWDEGKSEKINPHEKELGLNALSIFDHAGLAPFNKLHLTISVLNY